MKSSTRNFSISVVGLGVMGRNIALNIADHGYEVNVYNRTLSKVHEIVKLSNSIKGHESLEDLIRDTSNPKIILLEVTAGNTVDLFLNSLDTLLKNEDIVIDCGNSDYNDTIRREKQHKYNFVGMGVSGGEYGARNGPSIMVGCKKEVYEILKPILENISAKNNNVPCCGWMGENGAGHFVKIIHNGIEYVEMQLLQEIFNMRKNNLEEIFENFNNGRLESYLLEICCKILKKENNKGKIVNQIQDKAEQKGTGKMCIFSGLEVGVEINAIVESVFARFLSNKKEQRVEFSKLVNKDLKSSEISEEIIEKALYLCKAVAYVQGFNLLIAQKKKRNWNYTIDQICNVWRDGCILRCRFLEVIKNIPSEDFLERAEIFISIYKECYESLKQLCVYTATNEIYSPVFSSCYMWLNGFKMDKFNGSLIQAMRDFFGRHGVIFEGKETNIDWE